MATPPKVVITLPAYNAERTLEKTVADIPDHVRGELILVDDASPDNTAQLARSLGISVHVHPANRGYGGNQKTCYRLALQEDADIIVLLHPDYQYEPKAVPLLISPILAGDADMTFGSRFAGLGDPRAGGMPWYRYIGNRLTTILENLLLGTRFSEMHSGMRAYTRDSLLSLPFLRYPDDFLFDAQLLVDAVTAGHRVIEVPIPTRYTKESSSIAMGPLVHYVTGGLIHCYRRSKVRGRRRGRRPVTLAPRFPLGSPRRNDWLLDTIDGYATAGKRLALLGEAKGSLEDQAGKRGWEIEAGPSPADAVVMFGAHDASEREAAIERAMQLVASDGFLLFLGDLSSEAMRKGTAAANARVIEYFVSASRNRKTDSVTGFVARRQAEAVAFYSLGAQSG